MQAILSGILMLPLATGTAEPTPRVLVQATPLPPPAISAPAQPAPAKPTPPSAMPAQSLAPMPGAAPAQEPKVYLAEPASKEEAALQLRVLRHLFEEKMISAQDYEARRQQILASQ